MAIWAICSFVFFFAPAIINDIKGDKMKKALILAYILIIAGIVNFVGLNNFINLLKEAVK